MSAHVNITRISTRARVLKAIRDYFRAAGMSPSHSQIGEAASIPKQRVGRYLEELQRGAYLTFAKGEACSIVMVDPCANISDADLRAACVGRGWIDPYLAMQQAPVMGVQVAEAHPVDPISPDWAADILSQIK